MIHIIVMKKDLNFIHIFSDIQLNIVTLKLLHLDTQNIMRK